MVLTIVGCSACLFAGIGIGAVFMSLRTPASEGRSAALLPLFGIGLLSLAFLFFIFNSMDGVDSVAMSIVLAVTIAIGFVRFITILIIQWESNKVFENELDQFSLRSK